MSYPLDPSETINMLVSHTDQHSKSHGFQEDWDLAAELEDLARQAEELHVAVPLTPAKARHIADVIRKNFIGMKLALMHSELSEALERLREVGIEQIVAGDSHFIEELADVDIRTMETAAILRGDLGKELTEKMTRNRERPYMHGKKAG